MDNFSISLIGTIALSLIGVLGDTLIKRSGNGEEFINVKLFFLGLLVYALTAFGWFFVMKHVKLSTLGIFYAVSTALFLLAIGILYFDEKLNNFEIIGAVMGIGSLILLWKFA